MDNHWNDSSGDQPSEYQNQTANNNSAADAADGFAQQPDGADSQGAQSASYSTSQQQDPYGVYSEQTSFHPDEPGGAYQNTYTQNNTYAQPPYAHQPQQGYASYYNMPQSAVQSIVMSEPNAGEEDAHKKRRISRKGFMHRLVLVAVCCSLIGCLIGGTVVGMIFAGNASGQNGSDSLIGALPSPTQTMQGNSADDPVYDEKTSFLDEVTQGKSDERPALTVREIAKLAQPAVIIVSAYTNTSSMFGGRQGSTGSGFFISPDGYAVTNYHVAGGAAEVMIKTADGDEYEAQIIGGDEKTDLLLLKVEGSGFPYLEMGDSSALEVGDLAVVIGNPLGMLHSSLTAGVISATERELSIENTKMTLLQTDAAINVGNSGGALLNCYGEVVGVVIAKSSGLGVEGLAYAIPIDTAKPIISELRSHGYVSGRPMLGIIMNNLAVGGNVQGVYVQSIVEGGAAEQAGLQAGDIITHIQDDAITSADDLETAKAQYSAGDTVTIRYIRNSQQFSTELTFGEMLPDERS
ncbi:MAG: S1C family serine protease [Christensenellales bacterium]|jgi:serine protease Do